MSSIFEYFQNTLYFEPDSQFKKSKHSKVLFQQHIQFKGHMTQLSMWVRVG